MTFMKLFGLDFSAGLSNGSIADFGSMPKASLNQIEATPLPLRERGVHDWEKYLQVYVLSNFNLICFHLGTELL